jgi:Inner membrane protein YgaP-like, transmembrane domain
MAERDRAFERAAGSGQKKTSLSRTQTRFPRLLAIERLDSDIPAQGVYFSPERKATMLYKKNVPGGERAVRILLGAMMMAAGIVWLRGSMLLYVLAAMGIMAAMTGFIGYCPMCSIAGRRLEQK